MFNIGLIRTNIKAYISKHSTKVSERVKMFYKSVSALFIAFLVMIGILPRAKPNVATGLASCSG